MNLEKTLIENMRKGELFYSKMDKVFANLRADHDVATLELSKKKIEELKNIHVDVTDNVSKLVVKSQCSNGLVKGVRGTGKSHLLLIARDKINSNNKHLCIYINLQEHLNIGAAFISQERFFIYTLTKQIKRQLFYLLGEKEKDIKFTEKVIDKIKDYFSFSGDKESNLEEILHKMNILISNGEAELELLLKEKSQSDIQNKNVEVAATMEISAKGAKNSLTGKASEGESLQKNENYQSNMLLDLETFKELILEIITVLELNGVTFYYDEWSTLSIENQEKLSYLIRGLSTSPIYHWIAYIPYKSSLGILEKTADFPNDIDLDLSFIYEENAKVCLSYFEEFINKRIYDEFRTDSFKVDNILRREVLDLLIKCSMGNTRDFGVILNKAWENYKIDFLTTGKNKVISKKNIKKAIKELSEEKQDNLRNKSKSKYAERLWNELVEFTKRKKHTHFAIELVDQNLSFLGDSEMEDLLYHRLIHLRKKDYPGKEEGDPRLAIYAIEPSTLYYAIFETRDVDKQVKLVTDNATIHNQIRRYTFDLYNIVNHYRIDQGKHIQCLNPNCKKIITEDMKFALENKVCIFCSTPLVVQ